MKLLIKLIAPSENGLVWTIPILEEIHDTILDDVSPKDLKPWLQKKTVFNHNTKSSFTGKLEYSFYMSFPTETEESHDDSLSYRQWLFNIANDVDTYLRYFLNQYCLICHLQQEKIVRVIEYSSNFSNRKYCFVSDNIEKKEPESVNGYIFTMTLSNADCKHQAIHYLFENSTLQKKFSDGLYKFYITKENANDILLKAKLITMSEFCRLLTEVSSFHTVLFQRQLVKQLDAK